MSIRVVIVFLLVMMALALVRGPAFRRAISRLLGIGGRPPRGRDRRD